MAASHLPGSAGRSQLTHSPGMRSPPCSGRGEVPSSWDFSGASGDSWDIPGSESDAEAAGLAAAAAGPEGSGAAGAALRAGRAPALLVMNKVDLSPAGAAGAAVDGQPAAAGNGADPDGLGGGGNSSGGGSVSSKGIAGIPQGVTAAFSEVVCTSAATGEGLDPLRQAVLLLAGAPQLAPGGVAWAVNERQAEALIRADEALLRVRGSVRDGLPLDFWTIDLRGAVMALGEVRLLGGFVAPGGPWSGQGGHAGQYVRLGMAWLHAYSPWCLVFGESMAP